MKVPDVLVSGNHEEIKSWRKQKSIERTFDRRSDLILHQKNKKLSQSKITEKESNKSIKFRINNEYDNYPDW